jgi:hypothetical protein
LKKHILFILPYLNQGGTEKQALSLIEGLGDRYKISLLAPDGKGAAKFRKSPILQREFTRWDFNFFKGLPELMAGIKEIQKEQAIDLVHVHGAHELMLPVRWVLGKVPIIFTVHGYHGEGAQFSYQMSCWFSNWLATQVISVCEAEYNLLRELGLNEKKLHLIYNGVKEPILDAAKSMELAERFHMHTTTLTCCWIFPALNVEESVCRIAGSFSSDVNISAFFVLQAKMLKAAAAFSICSSFPSLNNCTTRSTAPGSSPNMALFLKVNDK